MLILPYPGRVAARRPRTVVRAIPFEGRIAALQDLRAIAALLVLFQHVTQLPAPGASRLSIALRQGFGPFGSAGVDLFFVISGFVIAHSIAAGSATSAPRFLLGRAIRILPLFWLMSAIYAGQLLFRHVDIAPEIWVNTATLVPLTGRKEFLYPLLYVGWSLGFELAFYAIASVALPLSRQWRVPALLALLSALIGLGLLRNAAGGVPVLFTNAILIEFALGVTAWCLWQTGPSAQIGTWLTILGGALFLSGLFVNFGQGFDTDPAEIITNVTSLRRALVWGLPAAMMMLGFVVRFRDGGLGGAVLTRIGDASFSLYLVHPIVLHELGRIGYGDYAGFDLPWAMFLFAVPIAVALPMHRFVEQPIMRWGNRWVAGSNRASRRSPAS